MDNKYISKKLSGRHGTVFGGSGGIGRATVLTMVAEGAEALSFTYGKNKAAAESLAKELEERGVRSYYESIERLDEAGVARFLENAVSAHGQETTMIVDAIGISPNKNHLEWTVEDMLEVYKINVVGSVIVLHAAAERMKKANKEGSIVLITSSNGVNSQAQYSFGYDGTKADQAHVMRTLAEPYGPFGIRINGVAPGWVRTSMNDTLPPGEEAKEAAKIWLAKSRKDPFAKPEEIAKVIAFLLSDDASYITGQNILVDGGYRAA